MRRLLAAVALVAAIAVPPGASAAPREIQIAYLQRMDWVSDYPQCMDCFVASSMIPHDWTITHAAVDLALLASGEQSISDYEMGIITGHVYYSFTPEEKAVLEDFVVNGGILWFDDCGNVEADNLPFGMEITFGGATWGAWGTCYGDYFTFPDPNHPLLRGVYDITPSIMRNDAGVGTGGNGQWFTPFAAEDPRYAVVAFGQSVGGVHLQYGPAILAARVGRGKIVATGMDITCALECGPTPYGWMDLPRSDYYFVVNMLGWVDTDEDEIWDRDEGAYEEPEPDTDGDGRPDSIDMDSDADTISDRQEAGDLDPDTPPVDTDGDTTPDFRDTDSDGDTISDRTEQLADSGGDGFPDPDADGDTIPNRRDADSDGDTTPDAVEGEGDADGDGIPNFVDANDTDGPLGDTDGDTIPNGTDNCPAIANGDQLDSDGDTVGDVCDDTPYPSDAGTDEEDAADDVTEDAGSTDADAVDASDAAEVGDAADAPLDVSGDVADGRVDDAGSDAPVVGPGAGSGCGCRTAGGTGGAGAFALFAALVALVRRRR